MATKKELEADIKQLEDILNSSLETEDRQQKTNFLTLQDSFHEPNSLLHTSKESGVFWFCNSQNRPIPLL